MTGGCVKSPDERLADPAVFTEIGGIARQRQAQQPHAVDQAAEVRLVLGDSTAVQFFGKRQSAAHVGCFGPSRAEWQVRTKLIDLGDQPVLDRTGVVADHHGEPQQAVRGTGRGP